MEKRIKVITGLMIILLALYYGANVVKDSMTYYRDVDTVSKNMDYYSTHRVKMIGDIVNNSIKGTGDGYSFDMESNGTIMRVLYSGTLPQTFTSNGKVVVMGVVDKDFFIATEMNVKCPTKYAPQQE